MSASAARGTREPVLIGVGEGGARQNVALPVNAGGYPLEAMLEVQKAVGGLLKREVQGAIEGGLGRAKTRLQDLQIKMFGMAGRAIDVPGHDMKAVFIDETTAACFFAVSQVMVAQYPVDAEVKEEAREKVFIGIGDEGNYDDVELPVSAGLYDSETIQIVFALLCQISGGETYQEQVREAHSAVYRIIEEKGVVVMSEEHFEVDEECAQAIRALEGYLVENYPLTSCISELEKVIARKKVCLSRCEAEGELAKIYTNEIAELKEKLARLQGQGGAGAGRK